MIHKGPLVDVILGVEYQHFDIGGEQAFCCVCQLQSASPSTTSATRHKATSFVPA